MHPRPNVQARAVLSSLAVFCVFFFSLSVSLSFLALARISTSPMHSLLFSWRCADARARTHTAAPDGTLHAIVDNDEMQEDDVVFGDGS